MPLNDFTQPGHDGELDEAFQCWRRGVTYTWRPGARNRVSITVRHKVIEPAYEALYAQCLTLLRTRTTTKISWQAWWTGSIADKYPTLGNGLIACASIVASSDGTEDEAEDFTDAKMPDRPAPCTDEAYVEYDLSLNESRDYTISYGEYYPPGESPRFDEIVGRATGMAETFGSSIQLLRREWFSVPESAMAVVMVYFRI